MVRSYLLLASLKIWDIRKIPETKGKSKNIERVKWKKKGWDLKNIGRAPGQILAVHKNIANLNDEESLDIQMYLLHCVLCIN